MRRRGAIPGFVGVAASLVLGCGLGGRGDPPPSPSTIFEPAVIGLIEATETGTLTSTVRLGDGPTYSLPDNSPVRLPNGGGVLKPGDLMLAGPSVPPTWWVDLPPRLLNRLPGATGPEVIPDGKCWLIDGGAFDEGAAIHFSSGLLLQKAEGFHVVQTWIEDPLPARASDSLCVDVGGHVTTLEFIWEPF
ncbi:MAG TPA: hypothetical protein VHM48_13960 [Candidatus Limnocylindrales bacterium]|nr:hypothetical protein [Candidatus Limnocylindrales bacterium]